MRVVCFFLTERHYISKLLTEVLGHKFLGAIILVTNLRGEKLIWATNLRDLRDSLPGDKFLAGIGADICDNFLPLVGDIFLGDS